jgi:hypothetical protein
VPSFVVVSGWVGKEKEEEEEEEDFKQCKIT